MLLCYLAPLKLICNLKFDSLEFHNLIYRCILLLSLSLFVASYVIIYLKLVRIIVTLGKYEQEGCENKSTLFNLFDLS